MKKILFRVLGTAHGAVGMVTLVGVSYLIYRQGLTVLIQGRADILGAVVGGLMVSCLIACGIATWLRPRVAISFAWIATATYIFTPLLQHLTSPEFAFEDLLHDFYYSSAFRIAAAVLLTIFGINLRGRSNNSFKPNPLRGSA